MSTGISEIINRRQLPNDDKSGSFRDTLTAENVDTLADQLARDYNNTAYRKWYCGVIYDFGTSKVQEWYRRSLDGNEPAKLFSKYVKDARASRAIRRDDK